LSESHTVLPAGSTLAHYTILEHLASGGMGSVYRAYEPALNRVVAIKVLKPQFAIDDDYVEVFKEEARSLAALRHPSILPIYYIGHQSGLIFFAMAFIEGEDGLKRIRRLGKLDDCQLKAVALQTAEALREAWRYGIIHRDIKPSNLLFEKASDNVIVADFGLARCLKSFSKSHDVTAGWGSPGYASPEQIMDQPCDFRSDIYSLGATLYHLATGVTAYESPLPESEVQGHLYADFPAEKALHAHVHPGWVMLIEKMMQKNPADRYQSYEELLIEISRVQDKLTYSSVRKINSIIPIPKRMDWDQRDAYGLLRNNALVLETDLGLERIEPLPSLSYYLRSAPCLQKCGDLVLELANKNTEFSPEDIQELRLELPEYQNLILKLASSPLFSDKSVDDFGDAVDLLGEKRCGKLGLALLISKLNDDESSLFSFQKLFTHGLATGILAEESIRALQLNSTARELESGFISHFSYVVACEIAPMTMRCALLSSIAELTPLEETLNKALSFNPLEILCEWLKISGAESEFIELLEQNPTTKLRHKITLSRLALSTGNFLASSYAIGYAGGGCLPVKSLYELPAFQELVRQAHITQNQIDNLVNWLTYCAQSLDFMAD